MATHKPWPPSLSLYTDLRLTLTLPSWTTPAPAPCPPASERGGGGSPSFLTPWQRVYPPDQPRKWDPQPRLRSRAIGLIPLGVELKSPEMVRPEPVLANTLLGKLPVKRSLNPHGLEWIPSPPLGQSLGFLPQQALSRGRWERCFPGQPWGLHQVEMVVEEGNALELLDLSYVHRGFVEEAKSFAPLTSALPGQPGGPDGPGLSETFLVFELKVPSPRNPSAPCKSGCWSPSI